MTTAQTIMSGKDFLKIRRPTLRGEHPEFWLECMDPSVLFITSVTCDVTRKQLSTSRGVCYDGIAVSGKFEQFCQP